MSDNPSVFCCPAHSSLSPSLSLSPPKLPPPPYSIRAAVRGGLSLCLGVESDLLASCTSVFSFEDTWRDLSVTKNEGVAVSYLIPPSRYSTSSLSYGSKSCAVAFPCAFVCLPPNKYNWQENVISGWGCTGPVQIMSIISVKNLQRWAKWNASAHLLVQDMMSPLQCLQIKKYEVSVAGPNLGAAEATLVLSLGFMVLSPLLCGSVMILASFTHRSFLCDSGVRLALASFVPQQETWGWPTLWQIRRLD